MEPTLIKPLHGLRGIAALTVLAGHLGPITKLFPASPATGVVLFFALSGFLMVHLYAGSEWTLRSAWKFIVARFARVYPLFALVIVANVLADLWTGTSPFQFGTEALLPHLLLFGEGLTVWTVSVEFQFYVAFLLIWLVYRKALGGRPVYLALALAAAATLVWLFGRTGGRIDLLSYLHIFLLGMLAGVLADDWKPDTQMVRFAGILAPVLLGGYLVVFVYFAPLFAPGVAIYAQMWVCVLMAALVFVLATAPQSVFGRLLGSKLFVWLGEISFGIYLLQRPVMLALSSVPGLDRVTWPLAVTALTLLSAWIAHVLVEVPARRAARRMLMRPEAEQPGVTKVAST